MATRMEIWKVPENALEAKLAGEVIIEDLDDARTLFDVLKRNGYTLNLQGVS